MKANLVTSANNKILPGVLVGLVTAVNEKEYVCTVEGADSTCNEHVVVLNTGSGYSMPKKGDQILYVRTPDGGWSVLGALPGFVVNGKSGSAANASGKTNAAPGAQSIRSVKPDGMFSKGSDGKGDANTDDKKLLSGNEFIKDIIGPDEKGWAANQRQPIKEGDHVLFDAPGGAHAVANTSGDVFFVFSDVNQMHFYKDNDLFKQFFKRGWVTWPGGQLRVGDYKTKDPSEKEEDLDLILDSTTQNEKKIRWRFQYGHNIEGDAQSQNLAKIDCFIGKPQGKETTEKKIYTKSIKKTLAYKEELKDVEEKKIATVDFMYSDQNKFKIELGKNDQVKVTIDIDISSGKVTLETKSDVLIKTEAKLNLESGGAMELKSGGDLKVTASGDINLNPSGSVNVA